MLDHIREIARNAAAADSAHDFSHSLRVLKNALKIAETEGGDPEVLTAAAFLHDIANLSKDHPESKMSSERSAARAQEILKELGFAPGKLAAVHDAILCHSFSRGLTPQTLDGRIFQDADRLDGIGAIGIARAFAVGGALQRPITSTLDHFEAKLFQVEKKMQTETGRALARERTKTMRDFVATLESEIN